MVLKNAQQRITARALTPVWMSYPFICDAIREHVHWVPSKRDQAPHGVRDGGR